MNLPVSRELIPVVRVLRSRMKLVRVALVVTVLLCVTSAVALAASGHLSRPFVPVGGFAAGLSGVGDGPSTPTGDHLRCRPGRRYAQLVTLRNRSGAPVTLTGATLDSVSVPVIRRVAVQFRLAPPPTTGDHTVVGLRSWSASKTVAIVIPSGRAAWVQSNFVMGECGQLPTTRALVYSRALAVRYLAGGQSGSERFALPVARIILTRKR